MKTARHPLLQTALFLAGALVTLTGCAKEEAPAIANAPYVKPEGWASECVGRIRVDVPAPIDFGAVEPEFVPDARTGYNLAGLKNQGLGAGGGIDVAGLTLLETLPLPASQKFEETIAAQAESHYQYHVRESYVDQAFSEAARKSIATDGKDDTRSKYREELRARTEASDEDLVSGKVPMKRDGLYALYFKYVQQINLGLPASFAWRAGETLDSGIYLPQDRRARLLHGYMGDGTPDSNRGSAEKAKAILTTLWPRYRVRTPGEIPVDAGICTPYGFFADPKGMTERDYSIGLSFRHPQHSNLMFWIGVGTVNKAPEVTRIEDEETPWEAEDKMVQEEKEKCRSTSATTGSIVSGCLFAGAKGIKSHQEVEYLTLADGQRARLLVMELHPSINDGVEYRIMLETLGVKDSATQPSLYLSAKGISSRVPVPGMQGNQPPPIKEAIALIRTMAQSLRLRDGAVAKDAPVKDSLSALR